MILSTQRKWLSTALLAAALSGGIFAAAPASAASGDLRITLNLGAASQQSCVSNREAMRALRAQGYRNVAAARNLGPRFLLVVATLKGHWYQLRINKCSGVVDYIRSARRDRNGHFTLYLDFNDDRDQPRPAPREELVCLVTFFDESDVAAGADRDVESARVLPRGRAEHLDRPNDRRAIFDYGTDQQTIDTCEDLDSINN